MAPSFLRSVEDERSWRGRRDAAAYLEAWPSGWRRPEAMAEIEAEQRKNGFVSQLRGDRGPVQVHAADFTADGVEAVTADGTLVSRWSLRTGALVTQFGERNRRLAKDPLKFGHGFLGTGLLSGGRRVLALTGGPHSLQVFGEPAAAPLVLPGDGYEGLATHGSQAALVHSVQDRDEAVLVDTATWRTTAMPHPELTMLRFAPNGDLLTVSRREGRWWRDGRLLRTVPMPGTAEPIGISTDARWVFVVDGDSVIVWNIDHGEPELRVRTAGEPASACSNGGSVYVGTQTGEMVVQSVTPGQAATGFRAHLTAVNRIFCGPAHVISAANNGNDARLWRIDGIPARSPEPAPVGRTPGWLVEQGLLFNWPAVTDFVRDNEDPVRIGGVFGIGAVCWLAFQRARRKAKL